MATTMDWVIGPALVLLTLVLVLAPAGALLRVVPMRWPWQILRVAAWAWIGAMGFFGLIYLLRACQLASLPG
jgi:hypothetical protein